MPARRVKKTQSRIPNRKQQAAKTSKNLLIVIAIVILVGIGVAIWQPWNLFSTNPTTQKLSIVKPKPDLARARQLTIDPSVNTVMQIVNRENVRITLEVPKGALKDKTVVKMIPFYYDKNAKSPTAGVIVSPGNLSFTRPVTLSFNFAESELKNTAPKNLKSMTFRATGMSQVLQIDKDATALIPTLIARGIETEKYLPARILGGGAYVFSLDGKYQAEIAQRSLSMKNMNTLTTMEAAAALLYTDQKLSSEALNKTKASVAKILAKKDPPPFEMFAALVLQKKIKESKLSLIRKAYAFETSEGYFQAACKTEGLSVEEYLGYAQTAQLLGHENIGDSCIQKAKNKIAEEAEKVVNNPNSSIKELMIALKNLQIVGLDEDTNLDERIVEKAKEKAVEEARKVAENPESSPIDAAKELQKLEALGVEEGPTYDKLQDQVKKATEKYDEPVDDPTDVEATIVEEEILDSAIMSAIGIAFAKAMGIDQLDEESMKKKFDQLAEGARALNEAAYIMCVEFGGQDCDSTKSQMESEIRKAEDDGYRAAEELGSVQSREYEEPEYLDENGDVQIYFEEELTPTPDENAVSEEPSGSDSLEYSDPGDSASNEDYSANQEDNQESSNQVDAVSETEE
jgi:hypothetical protein